MSVPPPLTPLELAEQVVFFAVWQGAPHVNMMDIRNAIALLFGHAIATQLEEKYGKDKAPHTSQR